MGIRNFMQLKQTAQAKKQTPVKKPRHIRRQAFFRRMTNYDAIPEEFIVSGISKHALTWLKFIVSWDLETCTNLT